MHIRVQAAHTPLFQITLPSVLTIPPALLVQPIQHRDVIALLPVVYEYMPTLPGSTAAFFGLTIRKYAVS